MRYKRLLISVTVILFITISVICLGFAFSTASCSITATEVSNSKENVLELTKLKSDSFNKKNLLFLKEEDIVKEIESVSPYIKVTSVKKEYPNKLFITVEEREELCSYYYNGNYYVLDKDFCVVGISPDNVNNIDGQPNVLLNCSLADFKEDNLKIGETFTFIDGVTNSYIKSQTGLLIENRKNVKEISVTVKESGVYYRSLKLTMKEGVTYTLQDASVNFDLKLKGAFDNYYELDDKSYGKYFVIVVDNVVSVTT